MKQEELFEMKPIPKRKCKDSVIKYADEGSTFSCMEPKSFQCVYARRKGESPMSKVRRKSVLRNSK